MNREGKAEVCEGADPYLVDIGGIAAVSGSPGVGVFIWACSHLLSEEPDFSPFSRIQTLSRPLQDKYATFSPLLSTSPGSPSLNSGALPPTLTIIPHAGRMRFPRYLFIKFYFETRAEKPARKKKCKVPLHRRE